MDYEKINLSVEDGLATIRLADSASMNAVSLEMAGELSDALRRVSAGLLNADAVILTGEGRGFCSGANLQNTPGQSFVDVDGKPDAGRGLETVFNPLMDLFRSSPIPIVCAVNGAAAGIGCSFALMADIVIAADDAYFMQAFRRVGLAPDGGSTYLLPRLVGKARAMQMVLLGERIPAVKALEWGLINEVVGREELMPRASAVARELAHGPKALSLIRKLVWDSLDSSWGEQLRAERDAQALASKTEDFREGVNAFLEKRPAQFQRR